MGWPVFVDFAVAILSWFLVFRELVTGALHVSAAAPAVGGSLGLTLLDEDDVVDVRGRASGASVVVDADVLAGQESGLGQRVQNLERIRR